MLERDSGSERNLTCIQPGESMDSRSHVCCPFQFAHRSLIPYVVWLALSRSEDALRHPCGCASLSCGFLKADIGEFAIGDCFGNDLANILVCGGSVVLHTRNTADEFGLMLAAMSRA